MVHIKYNHGVGKVGFCAALFIMIAGFFVTLHSPVLAGSIAWPSGIPPNFSVDEVQNPPIPLAGCSTEKLYLGHDLGKADVCVVDRGGWRYGKYIYTAPVTGYSETGFAVGIGADAKMYRMRGVPEIIPALHSDTVVYRTTDLYFYHILNVVKNFPTKLTRAVNYDPSSLANEYEFQHEPDFILKRPNGTVLKVEAVGISPNGKWLAAELPQTGIILLNLETFQVKRVSTLAVPYWHGANPSVQFAVSDDGRHVAAMGLNFSTAVIDVTDDCGDAITNEMNETTKMTRPCKELDLYSYFSDKLNHFTYGYYPSFDEEGGQLKFLAGFNDGSVKWVTLTVAGYSPPAQLDYLALGDSYSSGEGDTQINPATGEKYYLPHTDIEGTSIVPEERCHLSSRSYPFLLRNAMDIPAYRMKSVACSGAVGAKDYARPNDGYNGQNGRLDVLKNTATIEQYKTTALNEFIPGRDQQVEFVKKYQPKAITVMAGGNDVDFGGVAIACAPPSLRSCAYASTDNGRARLGSAIAKQYMSMAQLYRDLHNASLNTKIYIVGYPQFVSDSTIICAANVRFSKDERIMARAAVSYLNDVIEAAAQTAGVKYINIENSLGFHTLCGGEEPYVTGLARSGKLTTDISDLFSHESFHPNAKGHEAIATAIQNAVGGKTFTEYNNCPDHTQTICPVDSAVAPAPASYFAAAMAADPTDYAPEQMIKGPVQKGKDALTFSLPGLEPNSDVHIKIFSDPIDLGTHTIDSQGMINVDIPIPADLPAGFHTLEVEAKTFSGEPVTFWQIIEVHGPDGDIDENGVSDGQQACLLVPDSSIDHDADGVDDGCDPEIGAAPVIDEIKSSSGTAGDSVAANHRLDDKSSHVMSIDTLVRPLVVNRQSGEIMAFKNSSDKSSTNEQSIDLSPTSEFTNRPAGYSLVSLYANVTAVVGILLICLLLVRYAKRDR